MQRPMCLIAILYGAGVILADQLPCPLGPLMLSALAVAVAACFWSRGRPWLLALALLLTGATGLTRQKAVLSPYDLRRIVGADPRLARVRGELVETPYTRHHLREQRESWRSLAELDARSLRWPGSDWQPACGRMLVTTPGVLPSSLYGGREVEVDGVLLFPPAAVAPGLFDYAAFLARQGIYYQLTVSSTNDWICIDESRPPRLPLADRFGTWAMVTLARGLPAEDGAVQLLWAMSLGWKTALSGEVAEPFMRSGTMHVFAISGLHIALIASLLVAVLRVFRAPRWMCGLLTLPLIWAYTGLTGWQSSAIRSTIMASVILAGWSLERPSDLLNSLAAAAFIILAWDPQQLFQASFQLSFAVVLSLALLTPPLDALRRRWLAPDPMLPGALRPRWHEWIRSVADGVTASLGVSLAAWLGSLPLIAAYFHLFTPASLLANLIVVPLSSAALACNLGSLCTGTWLTGTTVLLNHAAWFCMVLMVRASEWAAALPGGALYVPAPSLAGTMLYYGGLAGVAFPGLRRPGNRRWALAALILPAAIAMVQWHRDGAASHLTVLPLHGGEAVYVQPAGRRQDLLVDCGNDASVEFTLKPFLRAQGVNHLDAFLLTHGDIHNTGGAHRVRDLFAPRCIAFSHASFRSGVYRDQIQAFKRIPHLTRTIGAGDQIDTWTVLHPAASDQFPRADDNGVVLRANLAGCRILLLSDLGKPGQNALLSRGTDLRADIVVSGLPARTEPLAEGMLDAIDPQVIVITDSEYPATQRAPPKLRERLSRREVPVLYTRETGTVTLTLRPNVCELTSMSGVRLRLDLEHTTSPPFRDR